MSIIRILAVACVAASAVFPPAASGAELHRCVSPRNVVGYHATACPQGHRQVGTVDYVPVPDSIARPASRQRGTARTGRSSRAARSSGAVRTRHALTRNDRCRIAKQQRRLAEERIGLRRTYADLGKLDAPVRTACDGY